MISYRTESVHSFMLMDSATRTCTGCFSLNWPSSVNTHETAANRQLPQGYQYQYHSVVFEDAFVGILYLYGTPQNLSFVILRSIGRAPQRLRRKAFLFQQKLARHVVKLFFGHFPCLLSPKKPVRQIAGLGPYDCWSSPMEKRRKPKLIGIKACDLCVWRKAQTKDPRDQGLRFVISSLWRTRTITAVQGKAG